LSQNPKLKRINIIEQKQIALGFTGMEKVSFLGDQEGSERDS